MEASLANLPLYCQDMNLVSDNHKIAGPSAYVERRISLA